MARKKKRILNENTVVFGLEPAFDAGAVTDDNYNAILTPLLKWYGQFGGASSSQTLRAYHKSWLKEWALANGFKAKEFSIPNQGIATVGAVARIALKGFPLKKEHVQRLHDAIKSWVPVKAPKVDREAQAKLLSLKAKIKNENALTPFFTTFDTEIDKVLEGAKEWDIKVGAELTGAQANVLNDHFKKDLKEIKLAYDKKDKELVAAYDYPRLVLRRLVKIHEDILNEIKEAGRRGKVVRKAKAVTRKRTKPASSYVKGLKYLPVHNEYSLTSSDPEKLVGASVAYVFDTKKRQLKKFVAKGISGIEVGGTTLKNIVGTTKTIRKPAEQLSGFASLPRTKAEKAYNEIRAKEKDTTGRMNADCVILGVY